jgi:predicted metal-dependent hydrolase
VVSSCDHDLLVRLNRLSVTRSFTPQIDIDWEQTTTDAEYEVLYSAWSLLEGTGVDRELDRAGRVTFVKYQQMNLMAFTGLLERHAISTLAAVYDLDPSHEFSEYLGHFIKEEIYHHMMFTRAVEKIHSSMPGTKPLPVRSLDRTLRRLFRFANAMPGEKLRSTMAFTILRFAEQVTIYAHQMVQSKISRRESLINQIWAFHALDEARHLAFDAMILERNQLWRPLAWIPRALAAPLCVSLSLLLNANEVWIARQLGVPVRLWQLPWLMRRTRAPFKRQVFGLLASTVRGGSVER